MRTTFILVLTQMLYFHVAAQHDQSFRLNYVNGDSSVFYRSIYLYPQFVEGHIFLKDQKIASGLLNYSRLSGQILFINSKGDTLEFANPETIEYIAIMSDKFRYFDKSFVKLVSHNNGVNLFKKETIEYTGKEKKGAYGGYSKTTAANAIDKVPDANDLKKIGVDENDIYVSSAHFFLRDRDGTFLPAVKRSFKKLFHKKEKLLNEYLSAKKINFNDEKDLLMFLNYLQR